MVAGHVSVPHPPPPPVPRLSTSPCAFWPPSPLVVGRAGTEAIALSARQRKQVYDVHVSHFSDGSSLHAPCGQVSPVVYDPVHQSRLLELVQANSRRSLAARTLPVQMSLPTPRDMRVTMNAGHGFVLPQSCQKIETSTAPLSDARIRRSSNAETPLPCKEDAASSGASSTKENKNRSRANVVNDRDLVTRSASVGERSRIEPSLREDLTKCKYRIGGTDAMQVISAAVDEAEAIPMEFRALSTELNHLDQRDQLCNSVRRRRSNPMPASERKMMNLSSSYGIGDFLGRPARSSPSSPPREGLRSSKQDDSAVDDCPKDFLTRSSPSKAERKEANSFTALVAACAKAGGTTAKNPESESRPTNPRMALFQDQEAWSQADLDMSTRSARERKRIDLALSPESPFSTPRGTRRTSHSPAGSTSRKVLELQVAIGGSEDPCGRKCLALHQSLSAAESPRRRTETNFSDIFGRESLKRPSSCGPRSDFADTADCSTLDNRAELSRSPRGGWSSLRQSREKNFSNLFEYQMPERPSEQARANSPEHTVREKERPCWESRIGMEMTAEIARRLKDRMLQKNGAMPSPDVLSASARKRLDMSSGSLRKGTGDSPRAWDDGRLGPGQTLPVAPTMRMRSVPDSPRFRQRSPNSARDRYLKSVLTSDNF